MGWPRLNPGLQAQCLGPGVLSRAWEKVKLKESRAQSWTWGVRRTWRSPGLKEHVIFGAEGWCGLSQGCLILFSSSIHTLKIKVISTPMPVWWWYLDFDHHFQLGWLVVRAVSGRFWSQTGSGSQSVCSPTNYSYWLIIFYFSDSADEIPYVRLKNSRAAVHIILLLRQSNVDQTLIKWHPLGKQGTCLCKTYFISQQGPGGVRYCTTKDREASICS